MSRVRTATVGYKNAVPLTDHLDPAKVELVTGIPAEIARMLHEGEVDVALVPVAAVLGRRDLRIVPGYAIGANGPVESVLFVAETPVEQWTKVVLDGESRTSAMLSRLLLAGPLSSRVRDDLEIVHGEPGSSLASAGGTVAGMVIGDAARDVPANLAVRLDLAELWKQWTGLPFVFAVWAARGDLPADVRAHLKEAAAKGVAEIPSRYDGDDLRYLGSALRYPLDDAALMGLRRFAALAHAAGLLDGAHVDLFGPAETWHARNDVDALLAKALDGKALNAEEALRLEAVARPSDLLAAADLVRRDAVGNEAVAWEVVADIDLAKAPPLEQARAASEAGADRLLVLGSGELDLAAHVELLHNLRPYGPVALPGAVVEALGPAALETLADAGLTRIVVGGIAGDAGAVSGGLPVDVVVPTSPLTSPEARVEALAAVQARLASGAKVERLVLGDLRTEKLSKVEGETATEFLRTVAIARLMFPQLSLEASSATHGPGTAQMALHAGCDRFSSLRLLARDEAELVEPRKAAVELHIREAGFEPVRKAVGEATAVAVNTAPTQARV
ncbi:MAG: hypothetical protein EP330_21860 [Deltaproteobacteria bacterium]|nr:MAG: hypothetical protein EP330_21860 [Deltaproteobacteria bacterium]